MIAFPPIAWLRGAPDRGRTGSVGGTSDVEIAIEEAAGCAGEVSISTVEWSVGLVGFDGPGWIGVGAGPGTEMGIGSAMKTGGCGCAEFEGCVTGPPDVAGWTASVVAGHVGFIDGRDGSVTGGVRRMGLSATGGNLVVGVVIGGICRDGPDPAE